MFQLRAIPWRPLLKAPSVWAMFVAAFARNLIFSAMVVEQPQYFLDSFNMNTADVSRGGVGRDAGWGWGGLERGGGGGVLTLTWQ